MKNILIFAASLLLGMGITRAGTVDQAIEKFLAGDKLTEKDLAGISDGYGKGPAVDGKTNNGSEYLHQVKQSIINPAEDGVWPYMSRFVWEERAQVRTYRELKAIYMKHKTPMIAYALVCPAMFVNDMELLPELMGIIAENKPLKAHFDKVYADRWKPILDPDF